jgi:hypothetical protein
MRACFLPDFSYDSWFFFLRWNPGAGRLATLGVGLAIPFYGNARIATHGGFVPVLKRPGSL